MDDDEESAVTDLTENNNSPNLNEVTAPSLSTKKKRELSVIRYISNKKGNFLSFPIESGIPSVINQPLAVPYPGKRKTCTYCQNPSIYCSKSQLPLCSFECYKKIKV